MSTVTAVVGRTERSLASRVSIQLGLGLGSGVGSSLVGAAAGWAIAWMMTFGGYGYTSFGSVALRVIVAIALVALGVALASLDRLPVAAGTGALIGGPVGIIFGSVSASGFGWAIILGVLAGILGAGLHFTQIPTLTRREINAYFYSPIAYVVATVFLILFGFIFWLYVSAQGEVEASLALPTFFVCHFVLPFLAPVLTMRLFAEEMRTGTIEVLMTAPVDDWEVVISKFIASLAAFSAMLLPTLAHVATLYLVSERGPAPAGLVGGYLGLILTAALFLAMGLLASSVTRNQIVAAILGFAMSFGLLLLSFVKGAQWVREHPLWEDLLQRITHDTHFGRFIEGAIDTRSIVYFVSLIVFILFLTVRMVESRKWR
jgi:ABC-2 type transport system permease protein